MTKSDLIKTLLEKIEKYKIDGFFYLLTNSINSSKYDIRPLEEEWEKIEKTENFGLFDRNQSISAFKAYFQEFAMNKLCHLTDQEIETISLPKNTEQKLTKQIDKQPEGKTISPASTKEAQHEVVHYEEDIRYGERPVIITVICVLGAISIVWGLFSFFRLLELYIQIDEYLIFISIIQLILHGAHIVGLWKMKKWNLIFYAVNFLVSLMLEFSGTISLVGPTVLLNLILIIRIVFTLFYWTVLGLYFKRMT